MAISTKEKPDLQKKVHEVLNAGPIQSRDLRRQSARFAEASQFLFSAVEDGTGGFENPRDARSDVEF